MSGELMVEGSMIVKAELDMQINTAKAYPRSIEKFMADAIEQIKSDSDTAESCFFSIRKGGEEIKGPSIRLAEIAASCWGNLHAGTRIIENDGKWITAQGVAWDLEKNNKRSADVKRSIMTSGKNGKAPQTYSQDMQQTTGMAAASIALRNAIFLVIPRAYINKLYDIAVKASVGEQQTLPAKRKEVFTKINKMGILTDKVLAFYGRTSIDEITADDLRQIIGQATSIKENVITIDKAFTDIKNIDNFTDTAGHVDSLLDDVEPEKDIPQ